MGNTGTQDIPPVVTAQTLFTQTGTKTVAATTSETSIIGMGMGTTLVAASAWVVGKSWRLQIRGLYSVPLLNLGTLTFRVKFGTVTISSGVAASLLANISNAPFVGESLITCRSTGSSGTVTSMGGITYGVGNNSPANSTIVNNGSTPVTVDTTADMSVDVTVQWSNNTAGNTISSLNVTLEELRSS